MKLITTALRKQIPPLYSTEDLPLGDKVVVAKFFTPWGSYSFYCIEGGQEDNDYIMWGLVTGLGDDEFGYSSLEEMESIVGPGGLGIERDLSWIPRKLRDIPEIDRSLWDFNCEEED